MSATDIPVIDLDLRCIMRGLDWAETFVRPASWRSEDARQGMLLIDAARATTARLLQAHTLTSQDGATK